MKRHPADPLDRWLARTFPVPAPVTEVRGWVAEALEMEADDPDLPAVVERLERLDGRWRAGDLVTDRDDTLARVVRAAEPEWADPDEVLEAWLDGFLAPQWADEVARRAEGPWRERAEALRASIPAAPVMRFWRGDGQPDPDPAFDLALAVEALPDRAVEVIEDLRAGHARAAADAALSRLRAGDDDQADDDEALAVSLVALRRALEDHVGDPEIGPRLAALDAELSPLRALTRLIEAEDHAALLDGVPPHAAEWWTGRLVTDPELEAVLVSALRQRRVALAADGEVVAERDVDAPGTCAVPLARAGGGGVLGRVVVHTAPGGLPLGDDARRALHAAWRAAARWFPREALAEPLGTIHLQVHALPNAHVEGESLGLPAALALVSRWSGRPIGAAATGRLVEGRDEVRVATVGAIPAKAGAVAGRPLLAPPGSGSGTVEVASLADAWRAVGGEVPTPDAAFEPMSALTQRIGAVVAKVELADGGWLDLLDRLLADLALAEARVPHEPALPHWRVTAAEAAMHAALPDLARDILAGVALGPDAPAVDRLLLDSARLALAIDQDDRVTMLDAPGPLLARFEGLSPPEQLRLASFVLATIGRAWTHANRPELAVAPLRRALDLHLLRMRHEAPRSAVYLAAALRRAGRADDALAVLDEAAGPLAHDVPRDAGPGYHDMTRAYWHYEGARAHLDRHEPELALIEIDRALRQLAGRPPELWPRIGFLRTRAWALAALGRSRAAELREIDALSDAAPGAPDVVRRIAAEARGPVRTGSDGEVY